MIEICRSCGFKHTDLRHIEWKRNLVSNSLTPFCEKCKNKLVAAWKTELRK